MWQGWVTFFIGIWVLVTAFYIPVANIKVAMIVAGVFAIIFSLWGAVAKKK